MVANLLLLLLSCTLLLISSVGRGAAGTIQPAVPPASSPSSLEEVAQYGCLDSERRALLQFKAGLEDPSGRLSSWQGLHCCQWRGVACDEHTGAVIKVDMKNPFISHSSSSPRIDEDYYQYQSRRNATYWVCDWGASLFSATSLNRSMHTIWLDDEPRGSPSNMPGLGGRIHVSLLRLKSLRQLDLSGNSFHGIPIPPFIGSFKELRYLDLSNAGFVGAIPPQLGNLSSLQYLDLSSDTLGFLRADHLDWVSGLSSLRHLTMDGVDLSAAGSNWVQLVNGQLPSLVELHLRFCHLHSFPTSLLLANVTPLEVIDLAGNNISSRFPSWLPNISTLVHVDVGWNHLYGSIPIGFSELPNLEYLDLSGNQNLSTNLSELVGGHGGWPRIKTLRFYSNKLYGEIPEPIGNLTTLVLLDLTSNNINGGIPASIGKLCQLTTLYLSGNNLTGDLPQSLEAPDECGFKEQKLSSLTRSPLPRLVELALDHNSLTGNLPAWLYEFGSLEVFDASYNKFTGTVEEASLSKLRNLTGLRLNRNSLALNISSEWVPPFQLKDLGLVSCQLGPKFPAWIKTQRKLNALDLSRNGISDEAPAWFWDLSSKVAFYLNISSNSIRGQVPSSWAPSPKARCVDMSSNLLQGHLPPLILVRELCILDLSANRFHGPIWPRIGEMVPGLAYLSLAGNYLTGEIPETLGRIDSLQVLDLSRNNLIGGIPKFHDGSSLLFLNLGGNHLSGAIPSSLGRLKYLTDLLLSDNKLSGEIPSSIRECSALEIIDLGNNMLHGNIPAWTGSLQSLRVLRLRSNRFFGEIPSEISNLRLLQVLDVADNNLSGQIPEKLGSLEGMVHAANHYSFPNGGYYYSLSLTVHTKGLNLEFVMKTHFLIITSIDLSRNKLSGEFPKSLMNLYGLVSLDLSSNLLTEAIPDKIGDMRQLQSLDLSNNHFSGRIPPSMAYLTFLGFLNMSNNNFSGEIPVGGQLGTFNDASFLGNPYLCGRFLQSKCSQENSEDVDTEKVESHTNQGFFLGLGLGFAFGLLAPFLVLPIKRSWCAAYFNLVDQILDKLIS